MNGDGGPVHRQLHGDAQTIDRVIHILCTEFELLPAEHRSLGEVIEGIRRQTSAHPSLASFAEYGVTEELLAAPSAEDILKVCINLAVFLMRKNLAYGDSALKPLRIMSQADPVEQIKVRMDDKLSRLIRGQAAGEDALQDLVGYYILLRVAEHQSRHTG